MRRNESEPQETEEVSIFIPKTERELKVAMGSCLSGCAISAGIALAFLSDRDPHQKIFAIPSFMLAWSLGSAALNLYYQSKNYYGN